jgi:ubiquinone/menaquinone biosynthesis C-methylase UbiE
MMAKPEIRFDDGQAYEQRMGAWSRLAGVIFLDWLAPDPGLRWIDVGCGNGAFTEVIVERSRPAEVQGVDPSEAQLTFARSRPAARAAKFRTSDAMALPFSANTFDAAVMALVIYFVSDPGKAVAEMMRVVRPGGTVAAYAWDMLGGGFPAEPILAAMRAMGVTPPSPPSSEASRMEALRNLWTEAGLISVETREISVQRTFADFDDFWTKHLLGSSIESMVSAMPASDAEQLQARVRRRLSTDAAGRILCEARANAIKGYVPM